MGSRSSFERDSEGSLELDARGELMGSDLSSIPLRGVGMISSRMWSEEEVNLKGVLTFHIFRTFDSDNSIAYC